ncbi:MAG: CPBP family intramembrane metalloprotease [Coriobacteriales bacterium]|jgi:membrane protease YdiL (CAAX protease family)|nr:CPBP family intramembrane metalloprotease [Coriobacteriales bacterium]
MNQPTAKKIKGILPLPQMIADAIHQSEGRPLIIEILIFVLVFLVGGIVFQGLILAIGFVPLVMTKLDTSLAPGDEDFTAYFNQIYEEILNDPLIAILALLSTIGTTIAVIIFCRFIEKRKLPSMGFRKRGFFSEYLIGLVIGTIMFTAGIAICYVTGTLEFGGISAVVPWGFIALFLLGYIFQGMSEEVLCRGYLLVSLARRQSMAIAVFVSSILFAGLHLTNPNLSVLAFINLFLFGAFAGVYFLKRGDIWGVGAIHSAWNFVQGNVFGIAVSGTTKPASVFSFLPTADGSLINGGAFGLEGGLAVTIVLVLFTIIMFFIPSRNVATAPAAPIDQPMVFAPPDPNMPPVVYAPSAQPALQTQPAPPMQQESPEQPYPIEPPAQL